MEPGTGSEVGTEREWLETLLDHLPVPMALVEAGSTDIGFVNRAAQRLAGGAFPLGPPEARNASGGFKATYPDGTPIAPDELPSVRIARGESVDGLELDWHTPHGRRALLVRSATIPLADAPAAVVISFDDVTDRKRAEAERTESLGLVDALFAGAPIGLAYFDRELRYRRVNAKLAEINGVPVQEHIGRTVAEVLPEMDPSVADEFRRVLETGEPAIDVEFVGTTPASGEEQRTFSTGIYPVRDAAGAVAGLGAVILDITARRRAEVERERAHALERQARAQAEEAATRARFLAEASVILDESLEYEDTLATVSRLVVPWLADWCVVELLEADGSLRRVNVAHVDPAKVELAAEWTRRYPPDPSSPTGTYAVARSGSAQIVPEISDEMLVSAARDDEHLSMIRSLGMRSAMIVPMIARGRTLGVVTFIAAETGRRYGEDDLLLAEELARRAATSIDNARLYEERSYIARTLQQSLLPPHLPEIVGIELAASYRPVGEGNDVGGDFYDVFDLGGDSWAVVIGDVCGKGANAAALTALVRYTVRAIATADKLPSEILRLVNDAILRQRSDNRFSTVVYARVQRTGRGAHVELTSGGHPLPLLVRADGSAETLGEPGTLLGVVPDPTLHDVAVDLAPGDTIVLYTDGVTEAGAPHDLMTPEQLAEVAARCRREGAAEMVACLDSAAVETSGGEPHDDIAIVALRVEPLGSELTPPGDLNAAPAAP
jgi:PAS domain S-box-containing protein